MKSYSSMVVVVPVRLGVDLAVRGDDEDPLLDADDVDRPAVKAREHVAAHDFLNRAERGAAAAEIEDAVHRAEERVQLVRGEEDGDAERLLHAPHQLDDGALVAR